MVPEPMDGPESLANVKMVVNISWPEESRASEANIIRHAMAVGEDDPDIADHLPDLISSQDLQYSTGSIRSYLSLNGKGSRIMRVLLSRQLYHITNLVGEQFWVAFWEIVRCHYKLWSHKIRHQDVSVRNLMYEQVFNAPSKPFRGKLNDFDLSSIGDSDGPTGTDRTGTMPFMALDLLTGKAADGNLVHEYRHDLESFGWALLWVCARFDQGREIDNPPFGRWLARDFRECSVKKFHPAERFAVRPTQSYSKYGTQAVDLVQIFCDRYLASEKRAAKEMNQSSGHLTTARNMRTVLNYGNDSMAELLEGCLKEAEIQLPISSWWKAG